MKSIGPEEFFEKLSENSNYMSTEAVKVVFYGLVRTISRELRGRHTITLPDWGTFKLTIHKSRKSRSVNDGSLVVLPEKATIKFVPDRKVKQYFYSLGEDQSKSTKG